MRTKAVGCIFRLSAGRPPSAEILYRELARVYRDQATAVRATRVGKAAAVAVAVRRGMGGRDGDLGDRGAGHEQAEGEGENRFAKQMVCHCVSPWERYALGRRLADDAVTI